MAGGVFSVSRDIFDHHVVGKDPVKFRAWLWMVSRACWKATQHDIGGKTVTLKRGQFATSYRQLAEDLGWSLGATQRFLTRLKTDTMIETQSDTGKMIITICKYSDYQLSPSGTDTPSDTPSDTKPIHERYTKEEGNNSSPNGEAQTASLTSIIFGQCLRFLINSGLSEKQARSMLGKWRKAHTDAEVVTALGKAQREGALDPIGYVEGVFRAVAPKKGGSGILDQIKREEMAGR